MQLKIIDEIKNQPECKFTVSHIKGIIIIALPFVVHSACVAVISETCEGVHT